MQGIISFIAYGSSERMRALNEQWAFGKFTLGSTDYLTYSSKRQNPKKYFLVSSKTTRQQRKKQLYNPLFLRFSPLFPKKRRTYPMLPGEIGLHEHASGDLRTKKALETDSYFLQVLGKLFHGYLHN